MSHPLTRRLRPDLKRAVGFGLLSLPVATLVHLYGELSLRSPTGSAVTLVGSTVFVALAVLAVRSVASEISAVSRARFGDAHASVLGLLLTLLGYTATTMLLLLMLHVPPQRLLVSGAVTGVVLGIAAQQSMSNVIAGLVLLLNRPFHVGQQVTIHSGAMGGTYSGTVLSIGLTYVQLDTADGVLLLPNSGVLSAAVGPRLLTAT